MKFELKSKDGLGRLGNIIVNGKRVETPVLLPVYNPNIDTISPPELEKDFKVKGLITNAYILSRNARAEDLVKKGVHNFIGFKGVVMTDSGTFQQYSQGSVDFTNEESLSFQEKIGSDIKTFLDVFTLPSDDKKTVVGKVSETYKRALVAKNYENVNCAIQGGRFIDVRRSNAGKLDSLGFDYYSVGGIVPLMESYDYATLVRVVLSVRLGISSSRVLHAFGAGHPTLFPLLALLGCDVFDSASYAIFAKHGRYLSYEGTKELSSLNELPCFCPVCSKYNIKEFDEGLLARHNLHVLLGSVRKTRQAIHENRLWELVESSIVHPNLLKAVKYVFSNSKSFMDYEPVRKRSSMLNLSKMSLKRPELVRALGTATSLFGGIPSSLRYTFPFNSQSFGFEFKKSGLKEERVVNEILSFQFRQKIAIKDFTVMHGKSGAIRKVFKDGKLLFSLRAKDGLFSLSSAGALELFSKVKGFRVAIDENVKDFARDGKDVLAKFVRSCDGVLCRDEVFVVTPEGRPVAFGTALMSFREMLDFDYGSAVKVYGSF